MSRVVSTAALQALFATHTDEIFLPLLRITNAAWATDVRLVASDKDIVSNGETFQAFPFNVTLPVESADDVQPSASLRVCAVDRSIIETLRGVTGKLYGYLSFIMESEPDTLIYGESKFIIPVSSYTADVLSASMTAGTTLSEPIPKDTFNPTTFPGAF